MRIIVSAGGSGGHIYPALAIIDKFKEKEKDLEVLYIGSHNRMEKDIVPNKGIKYESLEIYGLTSNMIRNFKNISLIFKAIKKCKKIIREFKPDIVIGTGGFVTYPVLKAAKKLKIKTFFHEQNALPGKTNRLLAKDIDLVGITFKDSKKYFDKAKKVIYTGHPNGVASLKAKATTKTALGFSEGTKLVTIVGGSQGSGSMNIIMKEYLKNAERKNYSVLYITGANHYDDFIKHFEIPKNVKVIPFYDGLPSVMKITDLFISRAGAGAVVEALSLDLPMILIPSPNVANNHQYYNALEIKEQNACEMIEEKDLNADILIKTVDELLNDKTKYLAMKNAIKNIKSDDSLEIIYKEIKDVLK